MIDNEKPGKIITIGSVRGFSGHPGGYGAYGTSKGAVHLMTLQLATEWAKYHINVNCIAPCIFWTPLTKQVLEDEKLKEIFLSRIPWGGPPSRTMSSGRLSTWPRRLPTSSPAPSCLWTAGPWAVERPGRR